MASSPRRRSSPIRALAAAGAAWGLALLIRPGGVVDACCPEFPASRLWIVRVLGARLVAQNAALLLRPGGSAARAASLVDGLHAASMLPLLGSARYRRAALVSGGVAAAWAALVARAAGGSERR